MKTLTVAGIVKCYFPDKGFGFIKRLDGKGEDVYLDHTVIEHLEGPMLQGQRLTFDLRSSDRGPRAYNVKREQREGTQAIAPDAPRSIYLRKRVKPSGT